MPLRTCDAILAFGSSSQCKQRLFPDDGGARATIKAALLLQMSIALVTSSCRIPSSSFRNSFLQIIVIEYSPRNGYLSADGMGGNF
jgi:hypothetical protein